MEARHSKQGMYTQVEDKELFFVFVFQPDRSHST